MKKNATRFAVATTLAAGIALASSLPAQAYPFEAGVKTCALQYHVAAMSRGYGEMYARVGTLILYANPSSISSVYNASQYWLRSSVEWETGAQKSYDYAASGAYCEHV